MKINVVVPSLVVLSIFIFTISFYATGVQAQTGTEKILIPIGGGYEPIYPGFLEAVFARAENNQVKILVIPTGYSSNSLSITENERTTNIQDAENRRLQIEEACKHVTPPAIECVVTLVPVFVHSDAENPENLTAFSDDITAVFILGGDQTVTMQAIANTPLEKLLEDAYQRGVIIAGTSAGGAIQSANMIGGFHADFSTGTSMQFGATDLWNTFDRRGLSFGLQNAILDQHYFQRNRVGRLLNAITLPDAPHVGIGVDAYTGVLVVDGERLENTFGLYTVAILDAETYHAADAVEYVGPNYLLNLRNILVHLLSPGNFSYDLLNRQTSLSNTPQSIERSFDSLKGPAGSGALFLGGDLSYSPNDSPALMDFIEQSGGTDAHIAIIASGYPNDNAAQQAAEKYSASIVVAHIEIVIIPQDIAEPWIVPEGITGLILIGDDQSRIQPLFLSGVKDAWLSGVPVFADNAAAAIIGKFYSAHGPTPEDAEIAEAATQKSFLLGRTIILPGLGMMDIMVEPQLSDDNRWGRFFSLAYNYPQYLVVGLNKNTVIKITPEGALSSGTNVALLLDLRAATLGLGTNQGFVIANGLLDVFTPAQMIHPVKADVNALIQPANTPDFQVEMRTSPTSSEILEPTYTPTPTLIMPSLTPAQQRAATRTPRPTNTPPVVPPAADPIRSNWMVLIAILAVIVVFIGVRINWRRVS